MSCKNIIKSAAFGSYPCGTEIQGGIRLCNACREDFEIRKTLLENPEKPGFTPVEPKALGMQSVADLQEKRDYANLDTRLYLALSKLRKVVDEEHPEWVSHSAIQTEWMAAGQVMLDFEDSHGPLPEWAIARNFGFEYVLGTQLFTRDGRRHGNAWLVKISTQCHAALATRENPYGEWTAYTILTEAGSLIEDCNQQELEAAFWAGDWICTIDRIAERFDRDGLLRAMGAC